ncbi:MAG: leucine-rich repeat domain-containing protein, partial [Clostridia bacterium]|nr:leucine-rich repeat domain-containing protein [Clostridia bacterium]
SITANLFRGVNCEIEIDEENPYFYYDGGYLIRRDGNEIIYAKDKTQPIPSYVRKIGDFVFYNSEMSELAVPEFIESIGDCAFAYCQNLKKVILPNGLKNLGASAFACCDKLEELNIPSGITRIENAMFTGCNSLNINIQLHITEIREQAFCHLEKPITLSKDVAITGPDVFKCATIYTSNDSVNNDKWHRVENGKYSSYWQRDCNIFICCDLREDGDSEYVYSWKPYSKQEMHTWIKNEEGETIEEVKTYYTGNVTFRDKAAFLNPSRRGYTFKGWTTKEGSDTVEYQLYISRIGKELHDGTVVYSLRLSIEQNKYVQLPEDTAMLYAVWEKN